MTSLTPRFRCRAKENPSLLFRRQAVGKIHPKRTQLLAMDTSVPRSMKSAAKCDNSREPQSPVTRRIFERTMRRGVLPRRVRSSVANQPLRREVAPRSRPLRHPSDVELGVPARIARSGISSNAKGVKSLAEGESPFRCGDARVGSRPSSEAEESSGRKDETRARRYPPVCPLVLTLTRPPFSVP